MKMAKFVGALFHGVFFLKAILLIVRVKAGFSTTASFMFWKIAYLLNFNFKN